MTDRVVVWPTPAAPPRVRNPMWMAMRGMAVPKARAFMNE